MDKYLQKLALGRAIARKRGPYFSNTIYSFIPRPLEHLGTMGVTKGMVLVFDPVWLLTINDEEVAACLVHEAFHHTGNHINRAEALRLLKGGVIDKDRANIAMDLTINPHIRRAGWTLPHGLFPDQYGFPEGLIWEKYYDMLEPPPEPPQQGGQQKGKGSGQGGKDPKGSSGQGKGGSPSTPPPGTGRCMAGKCGGIAGNPFMDEAAVDGEARRSEAEQRQIRKQTLHDTDKHFKGQGRGSMPGDLQQQMKLEEKKHEVNWRRELAYTLRKATGRIEGGGMDFSLARPSKRSPARGFPRPGLVQYTPEIAIIIDTSGSMGKEQLIDGVNETIGIFKTLGIDTAWLLQADTAVAHKARVRLRDLQGSMKFHGRGGTSFDAALKTLETLKPRPALAVYFTDGDGSVSYKPQGIEVVWCIVRNHWNQKPMVDWGRTIIMADKEKS